MLIRLTQIDGKLPNLALMKLAHWHKSKGDTVMFERSISKGIFEPDYDVVYGSAIFTTSMKKIKQFATNFPNSIIGGSFTTEKHHTEEQKIIFSEIKNIATVAGIKQSVEEYLGMEKYSYENYDYTIYPKFEHSIGFTQRGCRKKCSFCGVPDKEGSNVVVNTISDIYRQGTEKKIHLLDNDFFGQELWKERSIEIIEGDYKVCFNQGINIRLIHKEGAELLAQMKYYDDSFKKRRIYTAWDNGRNDEKVFKIGIQTMLDAGVKPFHIMVYMLCGYWNNESWEDIKWRANEMVKLKLMPYPMRHLKAMNEPSRYEYRRKKGYTHFDDLGKFQDYYIDRRYQFIEWEQFINETEKDYYNRKNNTQLQTSLF